MVPYRASQLGSNTGCVLVAAAMGDPADANATCTKYTDAVINALSAGKVFFSRVDQNAPLYTRYSGVIKIDGPPGNVVQSQNLADVVNAVPNYTPEYGYWVFFHQQNWYHADRCFGAQPASFRLSLEYLGGAAANGAAAKYACSGACNADCPIYVGTGVAEVFVR